MADIKKIVKRNEQKEEYKWRLEDIFPDNKRWEEEFQKLKELIKEVSKYQGKLGESANNLLHTLKLTDEISLLQERLFTYAYMRRDEDTANTTYQALSDKAQKISVEVSGALSFITPEILAIPDNQLASYIESNNELKHYKQAIAEIIRQKEHTLSKEEEQILALTEELAHAPSEIFNMLNNADLKFPTVKDENGEEVELTKSRYSQFMESKDRRVRLEAFTTLYSTYEKQKNTIAAIISANVKKDIFYSQIRKYPSALAASLSQDNVDVSVYENLITTIHESLPLLHRYMKIRKKLLGLDELHMYDLYVPMVKDVEIKITYDEAKEHVLQAVKPLGEEYISVFKEGLNNRWIDVYENEGKRGGAYSWGAYGTHPYVLLNHQDNVDSMFTLAHEMGHALHTYFSNANQSYTYAHYKIFVAEVASTLNEALLMDYMLKRAEDKNVKMYFINHYLEQFRTTVYRQVMFAEFEKLMHEAVEQGEALTTEWLNTNYYELNKKYYGSDVVVDQEISLEWARIPHFYMNFYVYKYATGFSAAQALTNKILNVGEEAVKRYLDFLKSGGSDYPLNLLKKAGVDLTTPEPIKQGLEIFSHLLDEMEQLVK